MPLRDHFQPPIWTKSSWEGLHGMWPATMVLELSKQLPEDFTAEPRVHLGTYFEIDVCAYEGDENSTPRTTAANGSAGLATATWPPPQPTLAVDADLTEQYEYEVLVYDQSRGWLLVAAVEIVSPRKPVGRYGSVESERTSHSSRVLRRLRQELEGLL